MAYELLTGRVPYRAETPVAVLLAHASKELPRPRTVNSNISLSVETAVTKALAKRPQDRYPNAMAFADALVKAAAPIAAAAASGEATPRPTIDTFRDTAQPVVRQMRGYWDRFVAPSLTNIVQAPAATSATGASTRSQGVSPTPTPPPPTVVEAQPPVTPASTGASALHDAPTEFETTPNADEEQATPPSPTAPSERAPATTSGAPTVFAPLSESDQIPIARPTEVVEPMAPSLGSIKTQTPTEAAETVFVSGADGDHGRESGIGEPPPTPSPASRAAHEALLAEIQGRPAPLTTPDAPISQPEPGAAAVEPVAAMRESTTGIVTPATATGEQAVAVRPVGQTQNSVDGYVENLSASLPPAPVALIDLYVRFAPMTAIVIGGLGVAILVVFRLLSSVGASVITLFGGVPGTPAASTGFLLIALGLIVGALTIYGGRQMQGLRSLGWWVLSSALVLGVVERLLSHVWAGVLLTLVVAYVHLLAKPRYR